MEFETKAIHFAQEPDKLTGAVVPPIHLSTTFKQEEVGKHKGFEYSRTGNPTRLILEKNVASLENGKFGLAFASGSAATTTIQLLLNKGDHVICGDDVYGGTFRFFDKVMKRFGIQYDYVDTTQVENVERAIRDNTRMIWLETPTNPLLKVSDIRAIAKVAKENGIWLVVDNTFASPYLQQPLDLGADIVIHSTTKYIGGHSDVVGGIVVMNDEKIYEDLKFLQNAAGAVPSPFDCWLVLRGLKTLALRAERHSQNAEQIIQYLETKKEQGLVEKIYYPFRGDQAKIAKSQMKRGGGMISFEIKGGEKEANDFLKSLELFHLAESLGGVESLSEYPPTMTHGSYTEKERLERGINPNLIRLSVGIENVKDLINDLERGFKSVFG